MRETLLAKAAELIEACACEAGCPSCVGPPGEVGDRAKEVALLLAQNKPAIEAAGATA